AWVMRNAWRHPESHFLSATAWLCGFEENGCVDVDVIAASRLRPLTKRGDVILTNLDRGWPARTVASQAVVATLAGAYVRGSGLRVVSDGQHGIDSYMEPTGFRARAFWKTLALDIFDGLRLDYLYVDPAALDEVVHRTLRQSADFELLYVERDTASGARREVYRIIRRPQRLSAPADV